MRLFTAVDLPGEVIANLEGSLKKLKPTAHVKWSGVENLHITTKFIGGWPEDKLEVLISALGELPSREPMAIAIRRLGWFPNPHVPRVFWAGVDAPAALAGLALETERCLGRLGVAADERPFSPHLTLARIKEQVPLAALRQAVAALPSLEFGEFSVDRFFLYQSILGPGGSEYKQLAGFPFQKP